MSTPTVTPTPKPTKKGKKAKHDDSIPFYDGSYYLIVTRIAEAVKRETTAIGTQTKRRFSALSLLGKLLAGLSLVALGAGLAAGAWFVLVRRDPDALRAQVRDHLAKGELVEARRDLEALRLAAGGLAPGDRAALAEPLRARLDAQAAKLRGEVERHARLGRHDRALAALDQFEPLESDARWALFMRAELLRASKKAGAGAAYERFVALYPGADQADDALFWQAFLAKEGGRTAEARSLCETLLWKYPKSNFRTASDRMLAELAAGPAR